MFDATAPPKGEELDVRYVGIWLDKLLYDENYHQDRLAPFLRLVIAIVGQDEEFRRRPRPVFEGRSYANIWGVKFGRPFVEGLFVEVPKVLAPELEAALRLMGGVRGILDVDQIEFPRFFSHTLTTRAWIVSDVLVGNRDKVGDDLGVRTAFVDDHAKEIGVRSREDAEKLVKKALENGIHEAAATSQPSTPKIELVEDLVVRIYHPDAANHQEKIAADVAIFDAEGMTIEVFEERLIDIVAANLIKKNYPHEIIVWMWAGFSLDQGTPARKSYFFAITNHGNSFEKSEAAELLHGSTPAIAPHRALLSDEAKPLLRWRPDSGLTRYWRGNPPPDKTIAAENHTVPLRHRIAGVVRRAFREPLNFRIDRFALENVRLFEALELATPSNINVFVGANASGKTTILEALAALLRVVVDRTDLGQFLHEDDVRELREPKTYKIEKQYPLRVTAKIRRTKNDVALEVIERAGFWGREGTVGVWMNSLAKDIRDLMPIDLPICAYYGVQRAYQPRDKATLEIVGPESRLDGYRNALDGRLDPVPFQRWLMTMEIDARQNKKSNVYLETVQEAVRQCIEGCEGVQYTTPRDEVVLHFSGGRWQRFRELSDGYRLMLATIADIALRCVSLNPHLGAAALKETSGVVLIDEIDLHLHPNWQRRVIGDLRRVFPRIQFFMTTHSPFIVQSLRANEVFSLDASIDIETAPEKSTLEDVAREILGVKDAERSLRFVEMQKAAEELLALLERTDHRDEQAIEKARTRYLEIAAKYSDDPAYLAVLAAKGAMRGVRLESESEST